MPIGSRPSFGFTAFAAPRMGGPEVEAFLMYLANDRNLSPSTHSRALSALLFFYSKVSGRTCLG